MHLVHLLCPVDHKPNNPYLVNVVKLVGDLGVEPVLQQLLVVRGLLLDAGVNILQKNYYEQGISKFAGIVCSKNIPPPGEARALRAAR